MQHRHLSPSDPQASLSLPAIDDIIARGKWDDWAALRRAVLADRSLLDKIDRICAARVIDPYAQRYHFWMHYAQHRRATA